MEEFLEQWSYLGIFLGIVATGVGFPMPEELPVVIAGVLAGHNLVYWWVMLPVCIVAVIIGDGFLYWIGRLWGPRLLQYRWVRERLLTAERLAKIEDNFHHYGVRILLFARLTPGIRAPIFITAGIIRLPLTKFVFADGIYAVPGVGLLFFVGYWFGESILNLVHQVEHVKSILVLVVLTLLTLYLCYRFLRKPMVTGGPEEMPPLVGTVTNTLEQVTTKIMHPMKTMVEHSSQGGHSSEGQPAAPEHANPGDKCDPQTPHG